MLEQNSATGGPSGTYSTKESSSKYTNDSTTAAPSNSNTSGHRLTLPSFTLQPASSIKTTTTTTTSTEASSIKTSSIGCLSIAVECILMSLLVWFIEY